MVSDPETAGRSHGRKKTDVTMRAEYELELDRRKEERERAAVEASRSGATPPGEMNGDDELAAAKEALQAALSRQQATERDLRLAKREAQAGTAAGSSRGAAAAGSSPTVAPRDAQIRQLNPAQLAAEAKARRDGIEAQRRAEREHKENAIFRGPEVAAVSQAARAVKQETEAMCGFMLESLETAVNQLREERDQLRLRLERAEAGLNSDIARVEGELSWIDFASSQCKKSLDDANLRKQAREKRPATPKSTWR